jgi:hypothetical protein
MVVPQCGGHWGLARRHRLARVRPKSEDIFIDTALTENDVSGLLENGCGGHNDGQLTGQR